MYLVIKLHLRSADRTRRTSDGRTSATKRDEKGKQRRGRGEEEEEEKEGTFPGTTCAQLSRLANTPTNAAHAISIKSNASIYARFVPLMTPSSNSRI